MVSPASFCCFLSLGALHKPSLLIIKGELKGVSSHALPLCDGMNPLRLAALDASPFCCAKRGGIEVADRVSWNALNFTREFSHVPHDVRLRPATPSDA